MSHAANPTDTPAASGRKWPVIIVSLLLLNVTVCAVTVTLSLRNPAAIEPDYYSRGLKWDESRSPSTPPPANATASTQAKTGTAAETTNED